MAIEKGSSGLKCGFNSLKNDVTILENARSALQQHNQLTSSQLSYLLGVVNKIKERVNNVKEHMHPCGHGSWQLVEYLDFRDAGTTLTSEMLELHVQIHLCLVHTVRGHTSVALILLVEQLSHVTHTLSN